MKFSLIKEFLLQTPWWVYLAFAYCIVRGIKSSKTRNIPLRRLFILPIIFAVISIHYLYVSVAMTQFVIVGYALALLVGIGLGFLNYRNKKVKVKATKLMVEIPVCWSTLIIILFILFSKYYFSCTLASGPLALHNTGFDVLFLGVMGVTVGLFMGRLLFCLLRLFDVKSKVEG